MWFTLDLLCHSMIWWYLLSSFIIIFFFFDFLTFLFSGSLCRPTCRPERWTNWKFSTRKIWILLEARLQQIFAAKRWIVSLMIVLIKLKMKHIRLLQFRLKKYFQDSEKRLAGSTVAQTPSLSFYTGFYFDICYCCYLLLLLFLFLYLFHLWVIIHLDLLKQQKSFTFFWTKKTILLRFVLLLLTL